MLDNWRKNKIFDKKSNDTIAGNGRVLGVYVVIVRLRRLNKKIWVSPLFIVNSFAVMNIVKNSAHEMININKF